MRTDLPSAVVLFAALLTGARGPAADPSPAGAEAPPLAAATASSDSVAARLERRIPDLMDRAGIPGLAAALVRDGRVAWTGSFGVRSAETGEAVTDETVFQAASLSKPVFAYTVLRLAQRGVLDMDRPLHAYRASPRLAHDPRYRRITARMVLSHSTGLPNWGGDTLELAFDPGTAFGYSGEGYVYLQEVVESLSGLGLAKLARREVFGPLGMTRSSYVWEGRFDDDGAVGHDRLGRPAPPDRAVEPNAAASLLTTAVDYARFVTAVLEGRGLGSRALEEMRTAEIAAGSAPWSGDASHDRIAWSLGWGLASDGGAPSLWHWGDNGDFEAFVAAVPEEGAGVVYFANSTHGLAVAGAIVREALGVDHPGPRWAGYEAHDDPERVARRRLFRAFTEAGTREGLDRLAELRVERPSLFGAGLARDLAVLLAEGGQEAAAIAVLREARGAFPDSLGVADALGRAFLEAGRFEEAVETYRELVDRARSEDERARFRDRARWVELRLRASRDPVRLPEGALRELAGDYGPRRVTLEDGALHYRRDGNPSRRLVPLAPDLFQPVGLETFRIRFVGGAKGPPEKIVGLYFDGDRDETPRSGR